MQRSALGFSTRNEPADWTDVLPLVLIGPHRLRLHLLPRRGERDGTEPGRDRPLQTQGGHRVPGRQKQAARGGGA